MFVLLWGVLFATILNADNVIKVPADSRTKSTKVIALNFESQIDSLEQNGKNIDEYTTKYFKKRVDYNKPFSSEIKDYQDSLLIEKMPKNVNRAQSTQSKSKPPNANSLTTAKLTTPKSSDSRIDSPIEPRKIYKKVLDSHKPKVVIIIDDIANPKQLSDIVAIQNSGLKLTPSIFPVAQGNAKMLEGVANLDFFMVHLPLEAIAYKDELDTISIYDSEDRIRQKIANIKKILPNAHYINNHTGSKFTEQRRNMETLLSVLDSHNISFVDSRTTPNTTLPSIASAQNRLILSRDIFIDNQLDSASLNAQIREGVKIAMDRGYAILIAHPHKETLSALKRAQNGALKEVDVIYLNELDFLLKKSNITQYAQMLKSP